jgi:hypothetical protein
MVLPIVSRPQKWRKLTLNGQKGHSKFHAKTNEHGDEEEEPISI